MRYASEEEFAADAASRAATGDAAGFCATVAVGLRSGVPFKVLQSSVAQVLQARKGGVLVLVCQPANLGILR
jgi:hypothetical protein